MPRSVCRGTLVATALILSICPGNAARIYGNFYEDTTAVVCQPTSTNVCQATFPATATSRYLTIQMVACDVLSPNGRSAIRASMAVADTSTGSSKRERLLAVSHEAGLNQYMVNTVVGAPFFKIGPGRFAIVYVNLGGAYPFEGYGNCTMSGTLTDN